MKVKIYPVFLVLSVFLGANCIKGPNRLLYEKELNAYGQANAEYGKIIEHLSPLLNENSYENFLDKREKKDIMEDASLLMAASLHKLDYTNDALTLFLNAYLLSDKQNQTEAVSRLQKLLPQEDLKAYRQIHIPAYNYTTTTNKNSMKIDIDISRNQSDIILQGICGDIFYTLKENKGLKSIETIVFTLKVNATPKAKGFWNRKDDRILLKRIN